MQISAAIIAGNEELKIAAAIKSLDWADEILVVDSESTDKTREIAESLGARVIIQKWLGFSKQKQFAVDNAAFDWIFSLDADEQVSEELKAEILKAKSKPQSCSGYRIPRVSFYMERPIRYGGWYPDWQIRLFDRKNARWKNVLIHESVEVDGTIETLKGDILHHSCESAAQHHQLIGERYAPLAARQNFQNGKRTSPLRIAFAGPLTFFLVYFLKLGFLDGFPGFCIAQFAAYHAFLKNLLLYEIQNKKKNGEP